MIKVLLTIAFMASFLVASAQQRDLRVREYISPTRIVWQQASSQIRGLDNLLLTGNGQSVLAGTDVCVLKSDTTGDKPGFLLDFGKELQGGLQLVTGMSGSHRPISIRIRLGESVSEAMCDIDGENGASNDHAMRDFVVQLPWLGVMEVGNSGFRFARIDLIDSDCELHIKEVRAISSFRDLPYKGYFSCNDERLNQIWQTGAYTVQLNMQDYLWDGIKRDRLVWVGDLHPEIMTISAVFGYNEVVPKSLDLIRDVTPLPQWMNGISSYSIWWLLIHRDWFYSHGSIDYLKEQQTYLTGLLRHLMTKISPDGKELLDGNRFLDWPSSENNAAIDAGLQSMMIMAMEAGDELCSVLGEEQLAAECRQAAKKTKKMARKVAKAIKNSDKAADDPGSKQAAALMALSGLMKPKDANKNVLSVNGAHGFSTFYGYYMLSAMAKAGNHQGALDVIRSYWGGMLDLGATSFWEDFDMKWLHNAGRIDELPSEGKIDVHQSYGGYCYKGFRHSFCHGWAAGPTPWLSEHVLGVQVLEPGCKKVSIKPHLGDLTWVEGTFPTPYGINEIRHDKQADGSVKSIINAPKEIEIIKND